MLTIRDVIDYSNLTEKEIAAIAAHEHVPKIIAAEMACQLVRSPEGVSMLKRIVLGAELGAMQANAGHRAVAKG